MILDLVLGFHRHPAIPHVLYRMRPARTGATVIECRCDACGESLEWHCYRGQEAASRRIDMWAAMHAHRKG